MALGELLQRKLFLMEAEQDGALQRGQPVQGPLQVLAQRRGVRRRHVVLARRRGVRVELAADARAVVDEAAERDLQQPPGDVAGPVARAPVAPRADQRLLQQIVGVARGQPAQQRARPFLMLLQQRREGGVVGGAFGHQVRHVHQLYRCEGPEVAGAAAEPRERPRLTGSRAPATVSEMGTPGHLLRIAAAVAGLLPGLVAQQLVHRDPSILEPTQAAFDPARGRLVAGARLGETWECDGTAWFRRAARHGDWAAARFVAAGPRLVAFATTQTLLPETWSYDGLQWQLLAPPTSPPARTDSMFAFDGARGRAVLFAGTAVVGPNYYLTDTWEFDGAVWTQRTPALSPPWRRDGGFAFDALRGVVVLFGGDGQSGFRQDTWEWNGAAWTQRAPANRPSARMGAAMAWDPFRGRVVLHGGLSAAGLVNDVWTFDGVVWQPLTTTNAGPGLYLHSLLHDPATGDLLAFGGYTPTLTALDGSGTWRAGPAVPYVAATGGPAPVVVDPARGGLVRFGELFDNRTHLWDRTSWTSVQTPLAPPRRIFGAMWSDGVSAWLFGGADTMLGTSYGDTWRWDGALWWPVANGAAPAPRYESAVAYDAARGVAVLFGGLGAFALGDTWTFDGFAWTQRWPTVAPQARYGHGLAFDPLRARTVLFGGTRSSPATLLADTWEWDGAGWTQQLPPVSPPAVGTVALGFDNRRQRVLLSQSGTQSVGPLPPSLWTFDGSTWTPLPLQQNLAIQPVHSVLTLPGEVDPLLADGYAVLQLSVRAAEVENLGAGCGTAPLRLWARTLPRPGSGEFGCEIDRAAAGAPMVLLLAAGPGAFVVGGCPIGVDPAGLPFFLLADARGAALLRAPLPPDPTLLGLTLFGQAFALAPGTPGGFVASPTLRALVGE